MAESMTAVRQREAGMSPVVTWTIFGTVLQLGMVIAGHYSEFVKNNVFAIGGMFISLVAGALYARAAARSKGGAAGGGAIVGGASALLGIIVAVVLGGAEPMILAIGTVSSMVTGAIGGLVLYALAGANRT